MHRTLKIILLVIVVLAVGFYACFTYGRVYSPEAKRIKLADFAGQLKRQITEQARLKYGNDYEKHVRIKDITRIETKWYEADPYKWTYVVSYDPSDETEYYKITEMDQRQATGYLFYKVDGPDGSEPAAPEDAFVYEISSETQTYSIYTYDDPQLIDGNTVEVTVSGSRIRIGGSGEYYEYMLGYFGADGSWETFEKYTGTKADGIDYTNYYQTGHFIFRFEYENALAVFSKDHGTWIWFVKE